MISEPDLLSQDENGLVTMCLEVPLVVHCTCNTAPQCDCSSIFQACSSGRWLWSWVTARCSTARFWAGPNEHMLHQSTRLGCFVVVWWMGTLEELSLFVSLHSNKTVRPSTVSTDILATVNACMCVRCFNNNRECGALRRLWEHQPCWVKCVSLCQWNHITLWSFFTHLSQYTQTLGLSQTVCQLSESTLRLSAVFFFFYKACHLTKAGKLFSVKYLL